MAHDKEHMEEGLSKNGQPIDGYPKGVNSIFASNADIEKAKEELQQQEDDIEKANMPQMSAIESHLAALFEDARMWKEGESNIQQEIIDGYNRRNGKYDQGKLSQIKSANSSEVFIGVTGVKCRTFESWVHDVYMNAKRKRTWSLKPTPIVDLPEEKTKAIVNQVMSQLAQEGLQGKEMSPKEAYKKASDLRANYINDEYKVAKESADAMSRLIHDQMVEGGWIKAFSEAIMDLSTSKACIIKGPIVRYRKTKTGWEKKKGKTVPKIEYKKVVTFERVSPLDIYPARSSQTVDDGALCEKTLISKDSLFANKEEPGYITENVEYILSTAQYADDLQYSSYEQEIDDLENRDTDKGYAGNNMSPNLEAIEFWVTVPGSKLPKLGIVKDLDGNKINALKDYDVNAITINNCLVYVNLNHDPLSRRPYSVYGFTKEIGGFWYRGIPEIIKNEQDIVNAAARAMVNNLGISSGPQVVIPDINRIPEGEDITAMYPWKIWQGTNMSNTNAPLVDFFQPDSRSGEMLNIMNQAINLADETLELPTYHTTPEKAGTSTRTSSGLAMLMSSSNRGLKRILLGVDRYIFQTIIERLYDYNMMYDENEKIKGDMNFISDGVISMIMKEELSAKRLDLLKITNNEFDQKILGMDGRAKILSDAMEALESDYDDIAPTKEKIEALIQQEAVLQKQAIEQNQIKIQKEQALMEREAQLAQAEIQLEQQKLQLKSQEMQMKDRTDNKELDIRASKQTQNVMTQMMKMEAQREDPDLLEVLGQTYADQNQEPLNEQALEQGEENELTEAERTGEQGNQQPEPQQPPTV
jgi:hypothetical protein